MFEQERLIGRLQRRVVDDPEILACFLSGSFGRRAADPYSDIDVALVYPNEQIREKAWRQRRRFAQSIMPYVSLKSFDGDHIRPYFHIVLFANGSKVDLRFETQESLAPNPWDNQIRILKDRSLNHSKGGWAEEYQRQSSLLARPQPGMTDREITALDQRFWVMYWDTLRLLARGDADKPFPIFLELLHVTLPPLLHALPPELPQRTNLITARFSRDTKLTAAHMKELLHAYLAARTAVVEQYHLPFTGDPSFEAQIHRLVERLV